jgi:hypothetical protein
LLLAIVPRRRERRRTDRAHRACPRLRAGEAATIEISERDISLATGEILSRTSLLQSSFPDTSPIIPAPSENVFVLPKAALEAALQASKAVSEQAKAIAANFVTINVAPETTIVCSDHCAQGFVETVIEARNQFAVEFRIDPVRLLASLEHLPGEEVQIQCDDPLHGVCIRHGGFLSLIATMRPRRHPLYDSISKEERLAGEKGEICGNFKVLGENKTPQRAPAKAPTPPAEKDGVLF